MESAGVTTSREAPNPTVPTTRCSARSSRRTPRRRASGTRCPWFDTVRQDGQLSNVQGLSRFFDALQTDSLPAVSWIVPGDKDSEHPPSTVTAGQTYVTGLINSIMHSSAWNSTAIFLCWDDWGGFYDHVAATDCRQPGLRATRPGTRNQPVREGGVRRPPDSQPGRLPQVHRGRLPQRAAARSCDGRPTRLAPRRPRERADSRKPREGLQFQPEAAAASDPFARSGILVEVLGSHPPSPSRSSYSTDEDRQIRAEIPGEASPKLRPPAPVCVTLGEP